MNRRRIVTLVLALFAAFIIASVLGLAGLGLYLRQRSGADYEGELAGLLPPNNVFYFSFNQPAEFLDSLERSHLWLEWERSGAVRAALDRKERLAKLQRNVETFERFTPYTVKDRIVKRWLGRHFVVALIPPPRPDLPPGLIVLAKTDAGFEEDLAEFVAENFPEVRRQKSAMPTGEAITVYRGGKPHRSFAFVRFGRTVALSLRSPETAYLEDIIRRRHDPAPESLASVAAFREWADQDGGARPLTLYCHPAESARLFLDHPGLRPEEPEQTDSLEWLFEKTEKGALLTGWLDFDREVRARFALRTPGPLVDIAQLEREAPRFESLEFATSQTLALMAVKSGDVARLMDWLQRLVYLTGRGPKTWEQAADTMEDALGRNLWRDVASQFDREAALLVQGVAPALLVPQIDAVAYVGLRETTAMRAALERRALRMTTIAELPDIPSISGAPGFDDSPTTASQMFYDLGRFNLPVLALRRAGAALTDDPPALVLGAAGDPMAALRPAWTPRGMQSQLMPLAGESRTLTVVYFNTRRLEGVLDTAYAGIPPFAAEIREDVERLLVYATLLAPFDTLTLTLSATNDGLAVELNSH